MRAYKDRPDTNPPVESRLVLKRAMSQVGSHLGPIEAAEFTPRCCLEWSHDTRRSARAR